MPLSYSLPEFGPRGLNVPDKLFPIELEVCRYYSDIDDDGYFSTISSGGFLTNNCDDENPLLPDGFSVFGDDCYDSYFSYYIDDTQECNEGSSHIFYDNWIADHSIIENDGVYHLFFHDKRNNGNIVHYETLDFLNWEYSGVVINSSNSNTDWDDFSVWAPHVIEHEGIFYMFYTGVASHDSGTPDNFSQRIGLLISYDLYNWERVEVNNCGEGCVYDCVADWSTVGIPGNHNNQCRDPFIFKDGERWLMYTTVKRIDSLKASVGVAESYNLIDWNPLNFIDVVNMGQAENSILLNLNGGYYLFAKCWGAFSDCYPYSNGVNYYYSDNPLDGFVWMGLFDSNSPIKFDAPEINIFEDGTYILSGNKYQSRLYFKRIEITDYHDISFFNNFDKSCRIFSSDINPGVEEIAGDFVDNNCDGIIE
tara:strand:- start:444 stop:1709 length:1266 start_codon:yes stop_codon:yes gene_type:complete